MTALRIVPHAQRDLRHIQAWIEQDNPDAAVAYLEGLRALFRNLTAWPLSGRARDELGAGLRSFVYREHLVFYRTTADVVVIVRVLHAKRDVGPLLR